MSADEDIGNELGKGCLILAGILIAVVAFTIYAWHHFRFVS
jgi:hypothetical protein